MNVYKYVEKTAGDWQPMTESQYRKFAASKARKQQGWSERDPESHDKATKRKGKK